MEYEWGDRQIKATAFGHGDPVRLVVEIRKDQTQTLVAELSQGAAVPMVVRIDPGHSAPSLLIASARTGAALDGSVPSPRSGPAWSSGATLFLQSESAPDFLTPESLDGIASSVALLDQLSAVARQVHPELADREAPIGPLGPEYGSGFREAAATYDVLVATAEVTSGSRDAPPDVSPVRDALNRLRECPGQAKLADRLRLELAARAFLEGHLAQARDLLPSRDDPGNNPEHAAAVLRDMQMLIAGAGEPVTWPAQEVARLGPSPAARGPRGPPVAGLGLLLPDASDSTWISPPEYATVGLPPLPRPAPPPRFVFKAEHRPVPPPIARELGRVKSLLREAFPLESARIRHRFNAAGQGPPEPPVTCEEDEMLFARVELLLELSARVVESIRTDVQASPTFRGMPAWYPRLLASNLRVPLTRAECNLVSGLHRKGTPLPELADRVARDRIDVLAKFLPQLVDASKSLSYARFPELHLEFPGLIDDVREEDFLDRIHRFVWSAGTSGEKGPGAAGRDGDRQDASVTTQAARGRLIQVLENPSIVYQGIPVATTEPFHQHLDRMLDGFPTVLNEVQRELHLPDAGRWTEPLLALIADARRGWAGGQRLISNRPEPIHCSVSNRRFSGMGGRPARSASSSRSS
ncbi:hypothetical protein P12x_006179 (plasmid) [Tundrisphaera lichenicola]|uniref:hypothetical protein n=1 Tax=Tundrisphaera lichenicola TaxID=2029860 RepID=UPI003EBF45CB